MEGGRKLSLFGGFVSNRFVLKDIDDPAQVDLTPDMAYAILGQTVTGVGGVLEAYRDYLIANPDDPDVYFPVGPNTRIFYSVL